MVKSVQYDVTKTIYDVTKRIGDDWHDERQRQVHAAGMAP